MILLYIKLDRLKGRNSSSRQRSQGLFSHLLLFRVQHWNRWMPSLLACLRNVQGSAIIVRYRQKTLVNWSYFQQVQQRVAILYHVPCLVWLRQWEIMRTVPRETMPFLTISLCHGIYNKTNDPGFQWEIPDIHGQGLKFVNFVC